MEYFNRFNKNDNSQARRIFMEVIKLDPNWGIGYAFLGVADILSCWAGWENISEKYLQKVMEYSYKAIALDDTLPEPYANLCILELLKNRFEESIAEAEKVIELQPNYFLGYDILGLSCFYLGELEKAKEMFKRAIRLSPKFMLAKFHLGRVEII